MPLLTYSLCIPEPRVSTNLIMIKKIQLTHFEVWKFKIQFLLETPKLDCCIMQQDNDDIDLDGLFGEGGTTNISILYCAKPFCFNLKSALLNGYNGFELAWVRGGIRKAWTKHLLHDFFLPPCCRAYQTYTVDNW